mmetsp:Transcript_24913/g.53072  ORF Transcript_24913/g.53072 Transcript_24913/m.53072 type:complete len:249 (+) Transcript_24913:870-1616(+)
MFFSGGLFMKWLSMAWAPACISIQLSKPIDKAIGVPMALHKEYRPPTQSQNPNMLSVSIPNFETPAPFVERAAKCLATEDSSPSKAFKTKALALPALVMVSCVVNVFEAIKKRVVSGSTHFRISLMCVPSMLEQKCMFRSRFEYGLSASQTITGPRSDPPIPMLTMSVMDFPVCPFHSPDRTFSVKVLMRPRTSLTSGMTSFPSTIMGVFDWFLKATCKTARPSVSLIFSPANIFLASPLTSCCWASP